MGKNSWKPNESVWYSATFQRNLSGSHAMVFPWNNFQQLYHGKSMAAYGNAQLTETM